MPPTRNATNDDPEPDPWLSLGSVPHRLNNSLALIIGCAEILNIDPHLPSHQQEVVGDMRKAAEQAVGVVHELQQALSQLRAAEARRRFSGDQTSDDSQ